MTDFKVRSSAAIIALGLFFAAPAVAEPSKFSADDLAKARTFIATQMEPGARTALRELAQKQGLSPEELFLSIRAANNSDKTLGGGSDQDNIPEKKEGSDRAGNAGDGSSNK